MACNGSFRYHDGDGVPAGAGGASAQNMAPAVLLDPQATQVDAGYGTTLALTSFGAGHRVGRRQPSLGLPSLQVRLWRPDHRDRSVWTQQGPRCFGRDARLNPRRRGALFMDPCSGGDGPASSAVSPSPTTSAPNAVRLQQRLTHPGRIDSTPSAARSTSTPTPSSPALNTTTPPATRPAPRGRSATSTGSGHARPNSRAPMPTRETLPVERGRQGKCVRCPAPPFRTRHSSAPGVARVFERAASGCTVRTSPPFIHPRPCPNVLGVAVATDGTRGVVGETRGNRAFVLILRTQSGWQLEQRLSRGGGEFGA